MNYRHAYHAGSFSDVFKHLVLTALIQLLQRKETPFCYLDTHAGCGLYDLTEAVAQKTKEYETGILKLSNKKEAPLLVQTFLKIIETLNAKGTHYYPGSPYLAKQLLRTQDRMVLCELHPEDYASLKKLFRADSSVSAHHQDGYLGLKAHLPPPERRGLILIDPPYEQAQEFETLKKALSDALKRFETGVYAIWYPIKSRGQIDRFHEMIKKNIQRPILVTEMFVYPDDVPTHLSGSGMLIINPPFQLNELLKTTLPWVTKQLQIAQGYFNIQVL